MKTKGVVTALIFLLAGPAAMAAKPQKQTVVLDMSPIRAKETAEHSIKRQETKAYDVSQALNQSFADRRDSEKDYQGNAAAGRPKSLKTETARVKVEVGDGLGGWSLRRNSEPRVRAEVDSQAELRRIESRLDQESREVRAEARDGRWTR